MKTYIKLLRIEYNHKIFDVYSDNEHRKSFLEVKIENNEEKYYYPNLTDYINLELIYNKKKDDILYSQKYSFTNIALLSGLITVLISNINVLNNEVNDYQLKEEFQPYQLIAEQIKQPSNNYYEIGNTTVIVNNDALTELGYNPVSFNDVRNTLSSNQNISEEYKEIISIFIDRLEERMPLTDLRIFNENLKTLQIIIIPNEEWQKTTTDGYYTIGKNTITLKEDYNQEEHYINGNLPSPNLDKEIAVLFHELGHTLNNSTIKKYDSNGNIIGYIDKSFQSNTSYGRSFIEGFNNVLTDYLLTDDWENYFDKSYHKYTTYQKTTYVCYQLLALLDNYNLYTYLNGNVSQLEANLERFDLQELIDALDANLEANRNIKVVDEISLDNQLQNLIKYRVNQLIENEVDNLEIYETIRFMDNPNNNGITLCTDLLNDSKIDWSILILEKEKNINYKQLYKNGQKIYKDEVISDNLIKVSTYDENDNLLVDSYCNNYNILITTQDGVKEYSLIYITTSNGNLCYKDAFTNEIVEFDDTTLLVNLENILVKTKYPNCNFNIKKDFLKSNQLKKYINEYYGITETSEKEPNYNKK